MNNIPKVGTIYVTTRGYASSYGFIVVEKITAKTVSFTKIDYKVVKSNVCNETHEYWAILKPVIPIKKMDKKYRVYKKKFDENMHIGEIKLDYITGSAWPYDENEEIKNRSYD